MKILSLFLLGVLVIEYGKSCRCGEYSGWVGWEQCSKTCGGGQKINRRRCNNEHSDRVKETRPCNCPDCPECIDGRRETGRMVSVFRKCVPGHHEKRATGHCNRDRCRKLYYSFR